MVFMMFYNILFEITFCTNNLLDINMEIIFILLYRRKKADVTQIGSYTMLLGTSVVVCYCVIPFN